MDKDLIFFSDKGITDTQANRVADLAKLSYTDEETSLSSLSFINESIETLNGDKSKPISYGVTGDLSVIVEKIKHIGDLKSLCAWLREAVSAHQRLISEYNLYTFDEYLKNNGIENINAPKKENAMNENDVIATFDIKKRNRYYYLEAQAATIGQLIHKLGSIDRARKELYDKISNPRKVSGTGSDIIIHSYEPSVEKEAVESLFYELQQKHADYQKELNSIKSEILSRISNDTIEKNKKFENEYKEFTTKQTELFNQYNSWKAEECKRIASLKIVIPNSLVDIYEKISNVGKNDKN